MSFYNTISLDAPTVSATGSTTPVAVQLTFMDEFVVVQNTGTVIGYVNSGSASTTTASTANVPILPGAIMDIRVPRYPLPAGSFPYVAVYAATGSPVITFTVAQGK